MKNILILLLAFLCIPVWGTNDEKKKPSQPTQIELVGMLETSDLRSLIFPVEAFEDDVTLAITTWQAMDGATVTISGVNGIVFSQSFSLSGGNTEIIDISNYSNGTYTLIISTPQGTYLTGTFEIGNF